MDIPDTTGTGYQSCMPVHPVCSLTALATSVRVILPSLTSSWVTLPVKATGWKLTPLTTSLFWMANLRMSPI